MQIPLAKGWNFGTEFPSRVLSCILRDPDFLRETYQVVEPHYFRDSDLVTLSKLVVDYFRKYGDIPDRDTLVALIHQAAETRDRDGALGFISTLMDWLNILYNKEPSDPNYLKDLLIHFGRRQAIIRAMNVTLGKLEEDRPEDGDRTIDEIQAAFNAAFAVGSDPNDHGTTFSEIAPRLPDIIQHDQLYGHLNKVPTGIDEVDKVLNGGLGIGEIGVIAGPPNRGKTTILSNLAYRAAVHFSERAMVSGNPPKAVVFVTLEMHENDIAIKLSAIASRVPINDIVTQKELYASGIASSMSTMSPVKIKFWSPGTAAVEDVKWYLSNLSHIHKTVPGLLVLDYADRLRGGEDDRFRGMGQIYDQLIALGNKFQMPVWTGSQINRAEADAKTIRSTGIAESWKKIEAADVVITLNQTEEEYEMGLMRWFMAKVRRGKRGDTFFLRLDAPRATVRRLTQSEMDSIRINSAPKEQPKVEPPPKDDLFKNAMANAPPVAPLILKDGPPSI